MSKIQMCITVVDLAWPDTWQQVLDVFFSQGQAKILLGDILVLWYYWQLRWASQLLKLDLTQLI